MTDLIKRCGLLKRGLAALTVVWVTWPNRSHALDDVTLVRDGRAVSVIVVGDKPTEAARRGAAELQKWLRKVTDAAVPIQPESRIDRQAQETLILMGDTKRTAALGLESKSLELEEIRIRTLPRMLVLIGDDERPDGVRLMGTVWAAETFAERHLGVRVLWPGELGEVVPRRSTVGIGKIDHRYVPPLRQRKIRNTGYNQRVQKGLDDLGWKADAFQRHHLESGPWFQFHRIGGSFQGSYGHAFGGYWKRFHKTHPEWFALQPDGTRDNSGADGGRRARLCVSNRGLIEQVARDRIEVARQHPTWDTVPISPNDGGRATFCQCAACKAWDAPEGQMIRSWGPKGPLRHVSLTDRYVKFYSAVAEVFAKEFPDRYLGAYAYTAYLLPPVRAKLHPNVTIGFVGSGASYLHGDANPAVDRDSWLKWSKAAKRLFLRPNLLTAGMGLPCVYVHRLAEDLRFCAEHGMVLTDFDCCYQHWATDGLNYYVLAKLLWDRNSDVDEIVKDYCRAGFGPAAEPIEAYFRKLEALTDEVARCEGPKGKRDILSESYTDGFLGACRSLFDEANRRAGDDRLVRQRIGFLRKGLEYARLRRDWVLAKAASQKGDRKAVKRLEAVIAERDQWYQELGISWALNVPYLRFYRY